MAQFRETNEKLSLDETIEQLSKTDSAFSSALQ